MPTAAKQQEIDEFSEVLKAAQSIVLTDFTGLNVEAVSALRRKCRAAGVEYRVIKNTLAKRALESAGIDGLSALLDGPNAWAVHAKDQVTPAKVLSEFAKTHEKLVIRGGFMEGRVLLAPEVAALAKLPNREVLLGQVAGLFQAPMVNCASVFAALLRGFATVVDAYRKQRAESPGES